MLLCLKILQIFVFACLFFQINNQEQSVIIKAKNFESACEKNLFRFVIDIEMSDKLNEYKNFYLKTNDEHNLLFKCMLDPKQSQIICITNLEHHKKYLNIDDILTLPYPFPTVDGIIWDYDSFLGYIYRRVIFMTEACGTVVTRSSLSKVNPKKWDLLLRINKIYQGQCLLSDVADNFYTFIMNVDILGGNLKDSLDNSSSSRTKTQIKFMQNITMPFTLGTMESLIEELNVYQSNKYYKTAYCYPLVDITYRNYQNPNGTDFKCNIPISDQYIFNGPLKIITFSDNIYARFVTPENGVQIDYISLYFSTEKNASITTDSDNTSEEEEEKIENNDEDEDEDEFEDENESKENNKESEPIPSPSPSSSSPQPSSSSSSISASSSPSKSTLTPSSSSSNKASSSSESPSSSASSSSSNPSSNLRRMEIATIKKKKEFLLLDNRKTNFICPDVPVFEITNIKDGIIYKPIPDEDDKFNIILSGYLKNGYKVSEKKIIALTYTTDEILFNLSIINNLAQDISTKKNNMLCSIMQGSSFNKDEISEIQCLGEKTQKQIQNTDLSINWATKENKYLNNILIRWPKDLTIHSKKIYSYDIYAISIKKTDYDCYDNKFYFYVNILDLYSEPQISFAIDMLYPDNMKADCKLYTSNLLKCILDLRLRKVKKGSNIRLPLPGNYNISTSEGNYINFTVFNFKNENETDIADEGIIVEETCGNNVLVGAIQDIGYNYISTIVIIICIFVIFGAIIFFIGLCVTYEITHRNKKKGYFSHVEEKGNSVNNTTVSNITNPQKTIGAIK